MRGLSGKAVIVTGGGGGIGTAACHRFVQEGAKVAVFDIDADSAGRTAAQITEAGERPRLSLAISPSMLPVRKL